MWCVHHGKVCIMLFDTKKKKSVFIPEHVWDMMPAIKKQRYV